MEIPEKLGNYAFGVVISMMLHQYNQSAKTVETKISELTDNGHLTFDQHSQLMTALDKWKELNGLNRPNPKYKQRRLF